MLLDRRRSHERGWAVGVPASESASSPSRVPFRSVPAVMPTSGGGVGVLAGMALRSVAVAALELLLSDLFCPTLASPDRAFPFCPSLTERAGGGVEKGKDDVRSSCCGYGATAVISSMWAEERDRGGRWCCCCCCEGLSSRTTARPTVPIPMPAPDAHS